MRFSDLRESVTLYASLWNLPTRGKQRGGENQTNQNPHSAAVAGAPLLMVDFSELITLLYAVGNVTSSVTLVLLNKRVFSNGFFYPMTLSFFHFVFTIGFYEALRVCGVYVRPEQQMPRFEKFKVAFAGFASIGFMNLSLTYNSVGFYQVSRLTLTRPSPQPQVQP